MIKINKFKKQTDRLLVVSEKKLYKVDAAKIKVGNVMIVIQNEDNQTIIIIIRGKKVRIKMQVMREEGLEQVTGLSCGTGDNQMVSVSLSLSLSLPLSLSLFLSLSLSFSFFCLCLRNHLVKSSKFQYSNDQVVVHMMNKNDLVVCLDSPVGEDRVGELVAVLATVRG